MTTSRHSATPQPAHLNNSGGPVTIFRMDYNLFNPITARVTMSRSWARECTAPGRDAADIIQYAIARRFIRFTGCTMGAMRADLRECGAWDDLETADRATLRRRLAWVAAGQIREEMNR